MHDVFSSLEYLTSSSRNKSITDLNQLRLWIETDPGVPDNEWYKDFGHSNYAEKGDIRKLSSCWQVNSSRNKAIAGLKNSSILSAVRALMPATGRQ